MDIERISPNQFYVRSDTGSLYKVSVVGEDKNTINCTCKGFAFRHACKHVDAVKVLLAEEGRIVKVKKAAAGGYAFIQQYKESLLHLLEDANERNRSKRADG